MRYLLALICPPVALLACRRYGQAAVVAALYLGGFASLHWGVGFLLLFICMLWAANAVGDERAAAESARFIRTIRPIRAYRG